MGTDKGLIAWHGREQRYYVADLLKEFCTDVFISCREEQLQEIDPAYKTLPDAYEITGPLCGILSAFKKAPAAAWLVVACDLPLLDTATIHHLLLQRDTGAIATTYKSPFDGLPEPLITVWEPKCVDTLLSFSADGFSCPRKALIRNEHRVKIIKPANADALMNANTPEDAARVKAILEQV
jgi:molybdopterin-guanine dinucleotide biosynthesis protein A